MKDRPLVAQLRSASRVVAVQPWMVRELGPGPAIWFSQLLWHMEVEDTTVIVRSDGSWEDETGLSYDQVYRARRSIVDKGWIKSEIRKTRGTPTAHIELDVDSLETHLRGIHSAISRNPGLCEIAESSTTQKKTREGRSARRSTPAPQSFVVTNELKAWARENVPSLLVEPETDRFLDYHRAKGSLHKDWVAAWRNWMRRAAEYGSNQRTDDNGLGYRVI
jgi:hypothetical protein